MTTKPSRPDLTSLSSARGSSAVHAGAALLALALAAGGSGCTTLGKALQDPASSAHPLLEAIPAGARVSLVVSACVAEQPNTEDGRVFGKHPFAEETKATAQAIADGFGRYLRQAGHPTEAVGGYLCARPSTVGRKTRVYSSLGENRLVSTQALPARLWRSVRPDFDDKVGRTLLLFGGELASFGYFPAGPWTSAAGAFTVRGIEPGTGKPAAWPRLGRRGLVLIVVQEGFYKRRSALRAVGLASSLVPLGWGNLLDEAIERRTGDIQDVTILLYDTDQSRLLWGRMLTTPIFYAEDTWPFASEGWQEMTGTVRPP